MILEAAKLSSGKSSPIAYMNGILANWKNNGFFNVEDLNSVAKPTSESSTQEEYNREYEQRRSIAISRAQRNVQKALSLDGFSDIYSRLNSIEKDLAFAEMGGNEQALKSYEQEKAELIANAKELLKSINLSIEDLSPKYSCEKCNDTGYIGTKRCDCFNKKA
jgi:DNA replication protein DnaC